MRPRASKLAAVFVPRVIIYPMPAPWKPPLKPLYRISMEEMAVLLKSDEVRAVQEPVAAAVGQKIVAHNSPSDSLNVVSAASIALYEARQR